MADSRTIAIGAPYYGPGASIGQVRVLKWDGSGWQPKGIPLEGPQIGSCFGASISMPDTLTLAIGAPYHDDVQTNTGLIRIFHWKNGAWMQKGTDLKGFMPWERMGYCVSMPDSNTVAVSSPFASSISTYNVGKVQVFRWNGTQWVSKGPPLYGIVGDGAFGYSLCMPDSNTLAVSCPFSDINMPFSSAVTVYQWNGVSWSLQGAPITSTSYLSFNGYSLSMPDAQTIAVGEPAYGVTLEGRVRIFQWDGNQWVLLGTPIYGAAGDYAGTSVSMPDELTVAVGAPGSQVSLEVVPYNSMAFGQNSVFIWDGSSWVMKGTSLTGEAAGDHFGASVHMPDAATLAVGAPFNDDGGFEAGHVRVFSWTATAIPQLDFAEDPWVFPNPAEGVLFVTAPDQLSITWLRLVHPHGKILSQTAIRDNRCQLTLPPNSGYYLLELHTSEGKRIYRKIFRK